MAEKWLVTWLVWVQGMIGYHDLDWEQIEDELWAMARSASMADKIFEMLI